MRPNITIRVWEIRRRFSPRTRIWASTRNIARNSTSRELPDANPSCTELHSHHAAAVVVEVCAERSFPGVYTATGIVVRRVNAGCSEGCPSFFPLYPHTTSRGCVQRHLVLRAPHHIHRFHDIDLSIRRPIAWISQPQRWPCPAANWCVHDVEDEESVCILSFGCNTDGESAGRCVGNAVCCYGGVDAENGGGGASVGEI